MADPPQRHLYEWRKRRPGGCQWGTDLRPDRFWELVDLADWQLDADDCTVGASNSDIDFQPADAVNRGQHATRRGGSDGDGGVERRLAVHGYNHVRLALCR